jgi:hypothetical protein
MVTNILVIKHASLSLRGVNGLTSLAGLRRAKSPEVADASADDFFRNDKESAAA